MRFSKSALLTSTTLTLLLLAPPAEAQEAAPQDQAPQDQATTGGIKEIIVTARKRQETAQDVPVAVTAISAEQIASRDITSVEKIAAIAPQFNVGRASNGSGAQLTLRGIGSSSTSIGIEQSVAVVVDGAYYGQGRVIQEGFFDLARVEVLKGPQALFFGKNATAGVISITTADPTNAPEFQVKGGYEFRSQQWRVEGYASMPLTDTLGIRLAARYSKMEGGYYRNVADDIVYTEIDSASILAGGNGDPTSHVAAPAAHKAPGEEEFLARGTLKWEPTSRLTVSLKGNVDFNTVNNSSWNYVAFACGNASTSQLNGYACGKNFVTHQNNMPVDVAAGFPFAKQNGALYNRYRSAGGTLNVTYDADQLQLSSVTNYQWNNNRWACACDFQSSNSAGGPGSNWATENSSWKAFSQELRALTQFDGPFNMMLGMLYQKTKRDFEQYVLTGGVSNSAAPPGLEHVATAKTSFTKGETMAVFGQLTYKILPTLELAGGARYSDETKNSYFTQFYNNPLVTTIFRDQFDPDGLGQVTARQHFTNWSPEATLTWKPTDDLMVYGAYKTAYKSGGFSNGGINSKFSTDPTADLTFDPEKAEGFEVGFKSTLLDRQLRFNVTAFNYKYKNLQVDFFNSPIFAFQTLTADARTKGVEAEFQFAPNGVPGLDLHGSVNYNKARYTDFPLAPCYAGQTPAQGCNLAGNTRQDLGGQTLSVAPRWTGNLGVNYEMAVGASMKLGMNVDARYSGSYLASAFGNPLSRQGKYVTLDAGLRFGAEDDNWQLAVIGKNLTNRFYVTGVVDGPSTGSGTGTPAGIKADQLGFGTLPRTVMVEVTKKF
ncbi:MAG: TonB-dependent receptor [Novosphingobium lindaniclasticum]|jgi:outer membrane receptor protein involved in Fe transport|uniref:TonB-dependent receptor n=1 Tax=Novosphingobium lindaniclasticum TaxID=1329895 RepID=UPI0024095511|nr:TonB-dependent receptor [Novosphingobium lindaniclasticum]MDF2640387.1 TonB-dependent receptor [Novosphingobium lindaniclasticum]